MIKAILIDDEPLARSIIREYLQSIPAIEVVQECDDGFAAIKAIQEHQPDLLFLDIQMPKISGFELLEVLENPPAIIFTTAFEQYALKAFEQHAVDYLLKPISKPRFQAAIDKFLANPAYQKEKTKEFIEKVEDSANLIERVLIKTGSNLKIIPVQEVIYFQADDDYVKVHTAKDSYLNNKTMAYFEKHLDPKHFVRIHRSFIIHLEHIQRIEPYEKESYRAILSNNHRVSISKSGYPKLMKALES